MTYGYKTLKEFKDEYIREAEQSIIVPEYSTNKEYDRQVANKMKEQFNSNPAKMFIKMNGYLRGVVRDDWDSKIINYQEEKETYIATLCAVKTLGINCIPTIYSYKAHKIDDLIQASALGYGNNVNIFLSRYLFDKVLSDIKEKEFVIGHELGHNRNNSIAPHLVGIHKSDEITRWGEYTADRAGLLVCKDVEAAARALVRVRAAWENLTQRTVIPEEKIKEVAHSLVENAEKNIINLPLDDSTHPCLERRVAAMKVFASSQMYARLTNIPVDRSMLSDEALEQSLARIIKGGK